LRTRQDKVVGTSLSGAGGPRRYGGCTVKETARMTRLLYPPNPEELAMNSTDSEGGRAGFLRSAAVVNATNVSMVWEWL